MAAKLLKPEEVVFHEHSKDRRFLDITGERYGRLAILGYAGRQHLAMWFCKCDCGNITKASLSSIRSGRTTSCGCVQSEMMAKTTFIHGKTETPEHVAYCGARTRCENKNGPDYKNYGGRGVKFLFSSFEEFHDDIGDRPSKQHSLDRINNNGNYEVGNVRWATKREQGANTRTTKRITIGGVERSQAQWGELIGGNSATISKRLKRGWCQQCAVTIKSGAGVACNHRQSA